MTERDLAVCIHRAQGEKSSDYTLGWKRSPVRLCWEVLLWLQASQQDRHSS